MQEQNEMQNLEDISTATAASHIVTETLPPKKKKVVRDQGITQEGF